MRGTAGLLSTLYLPEHWRGLQGSGATHTNTSAITTPREGDCSKVYKSALEWVAKRVPAAPVNVMAQFHPNNFCDPVSVKYRDKYEEADTQRA